MSDRLFYFILMFIAITLGSVVGTILNHYWPDPLGIWQ